MHITITATDSTVSVVTPYSDDFVKRCRQLGGKWNSSAKAWAFPLALKDDVLAALNDCYGYVTDRSQERVTMKVTVHQDLSTHCGPVKFGPYELARARGRDSGARPGPNVALIEGDIRSGGSMKNWKSWVSGGSVFKLTDVPISVAERLREIAIADTYTEHEPADDVVRQLETATGFPPDGDGRPEGYTWKRLSDGNYVWLRPVVRQNFTIEEV